MPYIFPKNIPKTKPKSYTLPITNPNHITPTTTTYTMVTNIIAKVNNIPVTNTFHYPNQNTYHSVPIQLQLIRRLLLSFSKECNITAINTCITNTKAI